MPVLTNVTILQRIALVNGAQADVWVLVKDGKPIDIWVKVL